MVATLSFARGDVAESAVLASGYAQAFQESGKSMISVLYTGAEGTEEIRGIRRMTAFGGVLLVEFRIGARQILDPARIIKMTID